MRTDGLCGAPSTVIPPQVAGGKAGGGFPDLAMKTTGGILLIAEIKPAVLPCLIDGENQALGYINAGNASDPPQIAWRTGLSVSVVAPMLEKHYPAKSFSVGSAQVKTTWCTPGLLGYSVQNRSNADPVPVPVPNPEKAPVSEEQKKTLRERLPTVPEWVWETIGVTAAAAVIACFALGPCDAAAILAAGEGVGWIIIQAMRLAGIAVGTMATTAEAGGTPMSVSGSASAAV